MKNKNNINKKKIIVIFLLVILLIILIHFFLKRFGKIGLVPTGNVDIFDIDCVGNDKECPNQPTLGEDNNNFEVISEDGTWNSTNDLKIFSNPAYEFKEIIAPGSSNVYNFMVKNNVDTNIEYNILFTEDNKHNIPMVFKLKKNNEYVLGNEKKWLDIDDFILESNELKINSNDLYSLEWKWKDSKYDESIGMIEAIYNLQITIQAK